MDKREQRTKIKKNQIIRTTLELFSTFGVERVTVDEIAAKANVSKVTIYKYFGSKDDLYVEVVHLFMEETLAETEAVFKSDLDFFEKLKFALLAQVNSSQWVNWNHLFTIWDRNGHPDGGGLSDIQQRVTSLIKTLMEEGKSKGLVDEDLPFDLILLYSDVFREGLRAKSLENPSLLTDRKTLEKLVHLYFWGLIQRQK